MTSLRRKGCCSVVYLDDFLFSSSRNECLRNLNLAQDLLLSLGFLINNSKSQLEPSRKCKYLGFIFDSVVQSIAIPPARRHSLLAMLSLLSSKATCQIKIFASMIGLLISICPAIQYGLLYTVSSSKEKILSLNKIKRKLQGENGYLSSSGRRFPMMDRHPIKSKSV